MKIVQPATAMPERVTFDLTHEQAAIALECLEKALDKYRREPQVASLESDLLPYLIHATILLFLNRDQRAFETIYTSPLHEKLGLGERLRQLPTLNQLLAVLNSRKADPAWQDLNDSERESVNQLQRWSDESLGIKTLKAFRDQLLINGVPPHASATNSPFAVPAFNYLVLCEEALSGWRKMDQLSAS